MKIHLLFIFISVLCATSYGTDTPVIGILVNYPIPKALRSTYSEYDGFVVGSNVKFFESAGARIMPVWYGQSENYYQNVINYTNGIVFPGSGQKYDKPNGYGDSAKIILKLAKLANDKGIHYPIFAICLGFEALGYAETGKDTRTECYSKWETLPLNFEPEFRNSQLFSEAPQEIISILESKNSTYNIHGHCLTKTGLKQAGILDNWNILSTNVDDDGLEFISSMEAKKYPFFGTQFHPEKPKYEFDETLKIPHTLDAYRVTDYIAEKYGQESRKNDNKFPSQNVLYKALIYNYPVFYTAPAERFEQLYLFKQSDYREDQLLDTE